MAENLSRSTGESSFPVRRMPGHNRNTGGKTEQVCGIGLQRANVLSRFNQPWEQTTRQAGGLDNVCTEISLVDIQHLAGTRHGDIGGELARQAMIYQR